MSNQYIVPVAGQLYTNRNGNEYCCLSNETYPNREAMEQAVALGEHTATMVRMKDGWSIKAHGLQQYADGAVEWNYSSGGAFRPEDLAQCQALVRQNDPAMRKYYDYLDRLRDSGEVNMYGAIPYLQREFPELAFDEAAARKVLSAWMDARSTHEDGGAYGSI